MHTMYFNSLANENVHFNSNYIFPLFEEAQSCLNSLSPIASLSLEFLRVTKRSGSLNVFHVNISSHLILGISGMNSYTRLLLYEYNL